MFELALYGRAIETRTANFTTGEHYALLWNKQAGVFVLAEQEQK